MANLGISLDFNPGHDSELKDAPVSWMKDHLDISSQPEDWEYKGWGIYDSLKPLITQQEWDEIKTNWSSKYEGRVRGISVFRF